MIRLFHAIGSILAALVLGSLATSSASATAAAPVVAYAYDSPVYGQPTSYTAFERGPPAARVEGSVGASQGAVDIGSSGTLARSTASRTTDGYTYDSTVHLAHGADAMTSGPEVVAGSVGDFSPLRRSQVAANGAVRTCLNSFAGDTLVLMADGTKKPIKDVKPGDKVMATDPETGETGPRKVST